MSIRVETPSLLMTFQDSGRRGYQRFGLPESGPMDWWAHSAANLLVGNAPESTCVELGMTAAHLLAESDLLLAVCGAGFRLTVNGREQPLWMAFRVARGDQISLSRETGGHWAYLAAAGGFLCPSWLGSHSAYLRAGLGRTMASGDRLLTGAASDECFLWAGRQFPLQNRPDYEHTTDLKVIPGPHTARFDPESLSDFYGSRYQLSLRFDRMGYRLEGPQIRHLAGADLVSQGMVTGAVQGPGNGQPIVMMPDHPTTGGYTWVGTVARTSLPLLAQAEPGTAAIGFQPITVQDAQLAYRQALEKLAIALEGEEDLWMQL